MDGALPKIAKDEITNLTREGEPKLHPKCGKYRLKSRNILKSSHQILMSDQKKIEFTK